MRRQCGAMGLFDSEELAALGPQFLKIVEGTLLAAKEVNDNISVIEDHPAGVGPTLASCGVAGSAVDGFREGLELTRGGCGGDDEAVGEAAQRGYVEQDNLFSLAFGQFVGDATCESGALFQPSLLGSGPVGWGARKYISGVCWGDAL